VLVVRPTEDADLPGLSELYADGFGRALPEAEWHWKYGALPGEARSLVAIEDGEVLAHAGALALPVRSDDGVRLGWQLTDFVGRPRGLRPPLVMTGRRLLADLPRPGDLPAIFGFPSARHLALGERVFGYHWLPPIEPWEGPIPATAGGAAKRTIEVGDVAGEWAHAAWAACGVRGVERTAAFLNWRYHARPDRYYRVYRLRGTGIDGLVVAAFVERNAWLAELWLPPGEPWTAALAEVAADLREAGLTRWRAWPLPGDASRSAETLRALGMEPDGDPVPCGCRGAPGAAADAGTIVALARSLYYAMGDHDMV
jgi:hypothetical protein